MELMRKISSILILTLLFGRLALAQTPTWSQHVAPIVYGNCSSCHHPGNVGPFSLLSYNDAYTERFNIQFNVENGIMPPWHPDTSYQHYANERFLSDSEVQTIVDWVNGGAPEGNPAIAPPPPVFPTGAVMVGHDLQLQMPSYTSVATTHTDDYVCISLDPAITSTKKIRAFEVIPANRAIVHHVLVYIDDANTYPVGVPQVGCTGPTTGRLIGAYIPGSGPIVFPSAANMKMGVTLNPGNKIVFAMHFPEGSAGQKDSTMINLHFYPDGESGVRDLLAQSLIQNWSFCIDPDSVQEVFTKFPPQFGIPGNYSVLSAFPHCHLLGKFWEVYGVSLDNQDTIPMIRINNYDFDWQGFYFFKNIIKLPSLYRIEARCRYDNTTNNIHNPNTPPIQVCDGYNTADEMMLVYFHFLDYQSGDELYDMDSLLQMPVSVRPPSGVIASARISPYPNPSNGPVTLDYYLPVNAPVDIEIIDLQGRVLRHIWDGKQQAGQYHARWDGRQDNGQMVASGLYFARLRFGKEVLTTRLIRE